MRFSNWGMFVLGIYLIMVGLDTVGHLGIGQITGLLGMIAGILILLENWRRARVPAA